MAYFYTCDICGCNLDPGEKCDCNSKKVAQEEYLSKVIKQNDVNGQMTFDFDRKENFYEKKAVS